MTRSLSLRYWRPVILDRARIIIVEDNGLIAEAMALTVEDADGVVIGPVATVAEALTMLRENTVDAAILDGNLLDRDVTPVALHLRSADIPMIIFSAIGVPDELEILCPGIPSILKPTSMATVVDRLADILNPGRSD